MCRVVNSLSLSPIVVERLVRMALEEDLGSGDITTEACIDPVSRAVAHGNARKSMVFAGGAVAAAAFRLVDADVEYTQLVADGTLVEPKTVLWTAKGRAASLLMAERVALNFTQRMSGVATLTRKYVSAVPPNCRTRVTDTRKTTPGLRVLERYAVRAGGGHNHRDNLGTAVLIKDNHIVAAGSIAAAIARARQRAPHTSKIECEVDSLAGLEQALAARADIIMLDNMDNAMVAEALRITAGKAFIEVSGGITLERIAALATLGVDAISVGALTHSAAAVDIGLDFETATVS
jgi:nicotinate-nucleotide pyrophosphorylase (carboxylating)